MAEFVDRKRDWAVGESAPPNPLAGLERGDSGEWIFKGNATGSGGDSGNGGLPPIGRAGPSLVESISGVPGVGSGSSMPEWMSTIGKIFGKGGIDPTMALGLGMSLFGGDDEQEVNSFRGTGAADPVDSLNYVLQALQRIGASMERQGPPRLRSAVVGGRPAPVSIPGLDVQIGGGLGMDPAMFDKSILTGRGLPTEWQPFQGGAQNQWKAAGFDVSGDRPMPRSGQSGGGAPRPVRRRQPNGY